MTVEAVHDAVALGDAAAARAVEADGVDLVEIGHGAVALGDIAELGDRRDVAVHRIDGFEADQLRPRRVAARQQSLEIGRVVVAEDVLLGAAVANALDHRGVIEGIGVDDAARNLPGQRRDGGVVRDIARGEQQCRFLAMQVRELALEQDVVVAGAGNVARAAGPGAAALDRLVHGGEHQGVLSHAEIVVGAPYRDLAARAVVIGTRKRPGPPLEIGEYPVASFRPQRVEPLFEEAFVIHVVLYSRGGQYRS